MIEGPWSQERYQLVNSSDKEVASQYDRMYMHVHIMRVDSYSGLAHTAPLVPSGGSHENKFWELISTFHEI